VKELRDCVVVKFPIVEFNDPNNKINRLYDNVKLLVFCTEPWKLIGTQAVAINEKIMYALVKCTYKGEEDRDPEYLIIAEKRIGEFLARGSSFYVTPGGKKESIDLKTLMIMHGEQLKYIFLSNPIVPTNDSIPTVVYNNITSSYGTGANAVVPGHDVESLKIASEYPTISKDGCLDLNAKIRTDIFGLPSDIAGKSIKNEATNEAIIKYLDHSGHLFRSFKYQNSTYKDKDTGERVVMLTKDSWFMRVSDKLKMRCL
jgi:isoleucyl-tRNA synthetase